MRYIPAWMKVMKIRDVFLEKVWYKSFVFKLNQNWISGNLGNMLEDFLRNRKQRVVFNGQTSISENIYAGGSKVLIWNHCCT